MQSISPCFANTRRTAIKKVSGILGHIGCAAMVSTIAVQPLCPKMVASTAGMLLERITDNVEVDMPCHAVMEWKRHGGGLGA